MYAAPTFAAEGRRNNVRLSMAWARRLLDALVRDDVPCLFSSRQGRTQRPGGRITLAHDAAGGTLSAAVYKPRSKPRQFIVTDRFRLEKCLLRN